MAEVTTILIFSNFSLFALVAKGRFLSTDYWMLVPLMTGCSFAFQEKLQNWDSDKSQSLSLISI